VKILNDKIVDLNTELRAKQLSLEGTTTAKDDIQRQGTRLTKKIEGVCSSPYCLSLLSMFYWPHTCFVEIEAELQALKAMDENAVAYFNPNNLDPAA
jgi:hypothetical protein